MGTKYGYLTMIKKTSSKKKVLPYVAVVVARFNESITRSLLDACLEEFSRQNIKKNLIQVVWVPGAFELPIVAQKLAKKKNIQAVICFGAVIRGETLHYELVAQEATRGIGQVALQTGKPIVFEVLAADTIRLCQARAQKGDFDNKGACAARVALEMIQVLKDA